MARITVEDCIKDVSNRFELVLLAAKRARSLSRGEDMLVDRDNDKNSVVALREIAGKLVSPEDLREQIIMGAAPKAAEVLIEEKVELEPTAENIFAQEDVTAEEERAAEQAK